jgi:hypothetical protein
VKGDLKENYIEKVLLDFEVSRVGNQPGEQADAVYKN